MDADEPLAKRDLKPFEARAKALLEALRLTLADARCIATLLHHVGASHHEVVERLVAAGARADPQWLDLEQAARLCKDERMRAALGV